MATKKAIPATAKKAVEAKTPSVGKKPAVPATKPAAKETKPTAKATTKATPKKTVRRTTKKTAPKVETYIQFSGIELQEKDVLDKVKKAWTKEFKKKVGDMKEVKIYIKPEEHSAYYVINDEATGRVIL